MDWVKAVHTSTPGFSTTSKDTWPLLPEERIWGPVGFIVVALSVGVAPWGFIIGGVVSQYLNAVQGTCAMIAGSLAGTYFVILATVPMSCRYGIDTIVASRPQLGSKGATIAIFLQFASIIGWNCLLLILLGRAAGRIAMAIGMVEPTSIGIISISFSLFIVLLSWSILRNGAYRIQQLAYLIAISVGGLGSWMIFKLISGAGIEAILTAVPKEASHHRLWNYILGFEMMTAAVISWWPYIGGMVRMTKRMRSTSWTVLLCMGLPTGLLALLGLYSGLVTGDSDPTAWLIQFGGVHHGVMALLFLVLANVGAVVVGTYVVSIGIQQLDGTQSRMNCDLSIFVALLPVAIVTTLIPDWFFEHTGNFFTFLGVFFAPMVGIQITDTFVLRHGKLRIDGLYDDSKYSAYYFIKGINPVAILSIAIGLTTYVYLLNPATLVSNGTFQYTGASLPAILASSIAYYAGTRFYSYKKCIGDYTIG
jgi:NCS1 family nucleobase:cation symporter-1